MCIRDRNRQPRGRNCNHNFIEGQPNSLCDVTQFEDRQVSDGHLLIRNTNVGDYFGSGERYAAQSRCNPAGIGLSLIHILIAHTIPLEVPLAEIVGVAPG